jgi:hypothetical protein
LNAAGDEVAPAAAFSMPEMTTFLNRRFYGIFTPPLTPCCEMIMMGINMVLKTLV